MRQGRRQHSHSCANGQQDPEIENYAFHQTFLFGQRENLVQILESFGKGTAGSPSWMTNKHLRPLLGKHQDLHLFFRASELLARGAVPESVVAVLRRKRMTALQKNNEVGSLGLWLAMW